MATHPGRKKGLGRVYHRYLTSGPGGWHCSCCNPYGKSTRKMKALAHRLVRRKRKQELVTC